MRRLVLVLAVVVAWSLPARADFMQSMASPGPLAESHASIDAQCDKCHVPFQGIPSSSCLACHTQTKARILGGTGPHAAWEKEGRKCASCHHDHKGRTHSLVPPVDKSFDHAITGFLLAGKHGQVACAACHPSDRRGALKWAGLPRDCAGCHADAHRGELGARCTACHAVTGWKPTTRTRQDHHLPMGGGHLGLTCASCHKQGTHLSAVSSSSCGDCHQQKHGGTRAPCERCHNVESWQSATFQHDFCTCILPGKHQTAPCLSCHPKFVFMPTPFVCAVCHTKDRRHEDLGACSRCHSALSWKVTSKSFDHNKPQFGFKLDGKHLEVGCENCHTRKGVFSRAAKTCEGCHAVPKHGDFGPCARCHVTDGFAPPRFSHDRTRFPLDGKHARVACQDCHAKFKPGQFQPGPNACALCHADPHRGQFGLLDRSRALWAANGPLAPHVTSERFGCQDCHTTRAWAPSTVDVAKHARFKMPLLGAHQSVACARCHASGAFVGTPTRCSSCHVDRHRGRLGGECERCHSEAGFSGARRGFDHLVQTGFALERAHEGLACAQCHGVAHERLATIQKVTCRTCHEPKHGEQFGAACISCHQTTKFSDVPHFDHTRTMFPLDRRHRAVRCTTCHDARRGARLDTTCRSCHDDPHRGRALLDCNECHRADRWNLVRFDHDRSEFPLRGRHFLTPCRDCHTNDQFTGVRSECVSCHRADRVRADSIHMDHRGNSFDCSQCHRAFNW